MLRLSVFLANCLMLCCYRLLFVMWNMVCKSTLETETVTENRGLWAQMLKQCKSVLKARSLGEAGEFS